MQGTTIGGGGEGGQTPPRTVNVRAQIAGAMLEVCGERGYRRASVQAVIDRCGGYRAQFYAHFPNKERCYLEAYEMEAWWLCEEMLKGTEAGDRRQCLRRALTTLAAYVERNPLRARGLLADVHVVAGPALAIREEVLERLSHALDRARRETGSRHSPPPLTANFIVLAIDAAVTEALLRDTPERFGRMIPEIEELTRLYYESAS